MSQQTGPLGDPKGERKLDETWQDLRRRELADLEAVLSTPAGRRFVTGICDLRLNRSADLAIKDGICAGFHTYYHEGRRDVGAALTLEIQEHFPDLWDRIEEEQIAQRRTDRQARSSIKSVGDE